MSGPTRGDRPGQRKAAGAYAVRRARYFWGREGLGTRSEVARARSPRAGRPAPARSAVGWRAGSRRDSPSGKPRPASSRMELFDVEGRRYRGSRSATKHPVSTSTLRPVRPPGGSASQVAHDQRCGQIVGPWRSAPSRRRARNSPSGSRPRSGVRSRAPPAPTTSRRPPGLVMERRSVEAEVGHARLDADRGGTVTELRESGVRGVRVRGRLVLLREVPPASLSSQRSFARVGSSWRRGRARTSRYSARMAAL